MSSRATSTVTTPLLQSRASEPPAASEVFFRASVPPYRLGELLISIAEQELTGRLLLQSDTGERTLYFHHGFPVFAQSSQFAERLGALGVRYGLFDRDDVAAALTLARGHGTELGRALLELEHIDGAGLFKLLSAQLVEQLAASCGSAHSRARFVLDPGVTDGIVVLRVHPFTAVLGAVRRMPLTEQHKMLEAVQNRRVTSAGFGIPTLTWLSAIGFVGAPESLLEDEPTVGVIRSRLIARIGTLVQQELEPRHAPLFNATDAAHAPSLSARSVADMLTLTLLLGGSLKLVGGGTLAQADEALPNTAAGVQAMLNRASDHPLASVPAAPARTAKRAAQGNAKRVAEGNPKRAAQGNARGELQRALNDYLFAERDPVLNARLAIWGPGAEVTSSETLDQLLTLYLTLKPERAPHAILALEPNSRRDGTLAAHAQYAAFLTALSHADSGPLVRCKVLELRTHIDDAVRALVPDALDDGPEELASAEDELYMDHSDDDDSAAAVSRIPRPAPLPRIDLDAQTLPPPAPANEARSGIAPRGDETPIERGRRSTPPGWRASESGEPGAREPGESKTGREDSWVKRPEVMYRRIDAMLRAGDYDGVCRLLDRRAEVASLPYELELARSVAHREQKRGQSVTGSATALPLLVATWCLGMAVGWALRHLDLLVF